MSEQNIINLKKIVKTVVFFIGLLIVIFIAFKSIFYLAPFIVAFAVSSLMEPLLRLLANKARLPRKIAAALTLLLVLSTFGFLLILIISRLVTEIISISRMLPGYFSETYNNINMLIDKAADIYLELPQEVTKNIEGVVSSFSISLMNLLNSFIKSILNTAVSIPDAIVFTIVTILSTYFLASDRHEIYDFLESQLPDSWIARIKSIINDLFSALFGYVKAQLIMMSITFTELSIGFSIIGVKHSILLALIISFIDALPILGTGGVLIPWSIYNFLIGDIRMGLSFLIIYGIALVVRQLVEPKVLSQQIGVHPLITLMAMYIGLRLFGVIGLILGPITVLLLKNIFSGLLRNKTLKGIISKNSVP